MELLNERTQVRTVAQRWRAQYGAGTYGSDTRRRRMGEELAALNPETAAASEVAEIVGNGLWVSKQTCDECGAKTWAAVQVGQTPNYESNTATICGSCLRAALRLLGDA